MNYIKSLINFDVSYWRERAEKRVKETPELQPYTDILLEYDWPELHHLEWVATTGIEQLLAWCLYIQDDKAWQEYQNG